MRTFIGVAVSVLAVVAISIILAAWVGSNTPVTWRTCQGSHIVATCLRDVKSLDEIKQRDNGCITDGHNVICGTYWQRQGRW